ncbi:group II intron maturase-specific domain-containing protein [Streptomyces iakyrus]|uniref:group II intron maturase-specific domain-containing protein n=1 Tax=Streptomyces iakyrus TaxID=68219 RepID=UPI002476806B|nr:group II intron maturase-specific domain-containing protein [Streptomyces iakyrus]
MAERVEQIRHEGGLQLHTAKRSGRSWRLHMPIGCTLGEFARWFNAIMRGWMQYYGEPLRVWWRLDSLKGSSHGTSVPLPSRAS